jgi:myo-inositol catabolism protein IolC
MSIAMTVDLHFVRGFAFGKDIFYFSIAATAEVAAAVERAQFVPAMAI